MSEEGLFLAKDTTTEKGRHHHSRGRHHHSGGSFFWYFSSDLARIISGDLVGGRQIFELETSLVYKNEFQDSQSYFREKLLS